ncbi:MAG: hypothetical protein K2R98_11645 [Gemmataceae bacterium]|nr:hypothetical protein [Gemmataceae bacterium]
MAQMAPPGPPPSVVGVDDDDRVQRLRVRLWQISVAVGTIFITGWFFTLGWIPGIVAAVLAKHILVAILVMGLGVDQDRPSDH